MCKKVWQLELLHANDISESDAINHNIQKHPDSKYGEHDDVLELRVTVLPCDDALDARIIPNRNLAKGRSQTEPNPQ